MNTRTLQIVDIRPAPYNPRTIDEMSLGGLRNSIERFGLVEPLVWNERTNTLVAGHARMKAMESMGMEEVEVIVVDLDPMDERALNVSLNNPNIAGSFTSELDGLLADIKRHDAELFELLNLDLLGDELLQIESALGGDGAGYGDSETSSVKPGEIYQIGKHRLGCGSSDDDDFVSAVLSGDTPGVALIDPPYDTKIDWTKHIMDPCIVFGAGTMVRRIPDNLYRFERVLVKPHRHRCYNGITRRHAIMVQCGSERVEPPNTVSVDSVWIKDEEESGEKRRKGQSKPIEMLMENLIYYTPEWSVCLDPYAGTGTTYQACEQLGRACYGVELDVDKCSAIVDMLASAGLEAERIS